jgi:hypothetical protein
MNESMVTSASIAVVLIGVCAAAIAISKSWLEYKILHMKAKNDEVRLEVEKTKASTMAQELDLRVGELEKAWKAQQWSRR